jgi:hypothetical protein
VLLDHNKDGRLIVSEVVPESPAAKAGLQPGDVLLGLDKMEVNDDAALFSKAIAGKKPGEAVELRWRRGDNDKSSRIELGKRPGGPPDQPKPAPGAEREPDQRKRTLEQLRDQGYLRLRDLVREHDLPPGEKDARKLLELYLDRVWPGDRDDDTADADDKGGFRLRKLVKPGLRLEWHTDGDRDQDKEAAAWKRAEESVARALKESNVAPDVREKVMHALEQARRDATAKDKDKDNQKERDQAERRARAKAEAAKIEKEMEALRQRAEKLREELKKE